MYPYLDIDQHLGHMNGWWVHAYSYIMDNDRVGTSHGPFGTEEEAVARARRLYEEGHGDAKIRIEADTPSGWEMLDFSQ